MASPGSHRCPRTRLEHESASSPSYGVPLAREVLVDSAERRPSRRPRGSGFPRRSSSSAATAIAHKTERDLVRYESGDSSPRSSRRRTGSARARGRPETAMSRLLVAEMVRGNRELIAGIVRDPVFGPCVMLGLGGVLTEALGDVVFAAAPLRDECDARRHARRAEGEATCWANSAVSRRWMRRRWSPCWSRWGVSRSNAPTSRASTSTRSSFATARPIAVDAPGGTRRRPMLGSASGRRAGEPVDGCGNSRAFPAALPPARHHRRRGIDAPWQVRLRRAAQPAALRLRGRGVARG